MKAHRHQVMEKMQVDSLAKLVSNAERLGMLDPGRDFRTVEHSEAALGVPHCTLGQ